MDSSASATAMSLYIRVKRSNQTIFLHVEPMDTFQDVKGKLKVILYPPDGSDANEGLQLLKNENLTEDLPDMATLVDHNIENDACIYLTVGGKF